MATTRNVKRNTARKPSVSLIGPGRLGIALAMALNSAGYQIVSLAGRNRQKLRKTAKLLDVSCQLLVAKELEKGRFGDLIIVSVPDDQIATVAGDLARIKGNRHPTVLHTSGALSSKVFASLAANGWHTGSIHPLASVSDPVAGAEALRNAYWCIEGDAVAIRVAKQVVRDLGARSFSLKSEDKPLYHAAAVMTSGNATALFDVALEMLERCGISRRRGQKMLVPLLESNTLNLSRSAPEDALTGTFARGDLATVRMHLSALKGKDLDEALQLYRLLGKRSIELVKNKIDSETADEIDKLLR
jgi:predicted short-subunit dehydrogenase-like oxidoreductase (DUF2520 family)